MVKDKFEVGVLLKPELKARLQNVAKKMGLTQSEIVRRAILNELVFLEKNYGDSNERK